MNMNTFINPFKNFNANIYTSEDVYNYWYNPFDSLIDGIDEDTIKSHKMPILIEGQRGSGKTMILKYLSYFTQKLVIEEKGIEFEKNYRNNLVGIYVRLDTQVFKNMPKREDELWINIFEDYFQLNIAKNIINILIDVIEDNAKEHTDFIDRINNVLDKDFETMDELRQFIIFKIGVINHFRKVVDYTDANYEYEIGKYSNDLYQLIIDTANITIKKLKRVNYAILLDEFENYNIWQQNVIAKKIKFVNNNLNDNYGLCTFRIGMRTSGLWQEATINKKEFLKQDNDYLLVSINQFIGKKGSSIAKYKKFLINVANIRLSNSVYFKENNLVDITKFLGDKEILENEASELVRGREKHFDLLDNKIENKKAVISKIRNPNNPLQEIVNILLINKGKDVGYVKRAMEDYNKKNKTEGYKIYNNYYANKYKYSAMIFLSSRYRSNYRATTPL